MGIYAERPAMRKLTPWYPGHIKPVRDGVYQTKNDGSIGYQRFEHGLWYGFSYDAADAARSEWVVDKRFQNDTWRGVAK